MLLGQALRHLELTDAQKAKLKELKASLHDAKHTARAPSRGEFKNLMSQAFTSGSVDRSAVDQALAGLDAKVRANANRQVAALNQLHGTLTQEQRTELIVAIEKRRGAKGQAGGKDKPRHAGTAGSRAKQGFPMLRGVELSDAQTQKLAAVFEAKRDSAAWSVAREERRARRAALLKAFGGENFDASTVIDAEAMVKRARERAERHVTFMTQAIEVLTPEQRAQVVERKHVRHQLHHDAAVAGPKAQ
jgi:Spy/CpxP family protein refolding chaperone